MDVAGSRRCTGMSRFLIGRRHAERVRLVAETLDAAVPRIVERDAASGSMSRTDDETSTVPDPTGS
jgi:hypothetical protein